MFGSVSYTTADASAWGAVAAQPRPSSAPSAPAKQWARRVTEKLRTAVFSGRFSLPPFLSDSMSDESFEIRNAYSTMLGEPLMKAGFGSKVQAVCALDVQCQPEDADNPREREAASCFLVNLKALKSNRLGLGGTRKLAWNILSGLVRGWSVTEMVWEREPRAYGKYAGKLFYRTAKGKNTARLTPTVDEFGNLTSLRSADGKLFVGEGGLADFVFYSHWPFYEAICGLSDFRAAYRPWWMKKAIWQFYGLGLEKWSGPYFKGSYPNEEVRPALEEALREAEASTWITVPAGTLVEVIEMSCAAAPVYEAALDRCDREMLLAVRGSYLDILEGRTPDGRGDTSIHQQTGDLGSWLLAAAVGDCITEQVAPRWYEINYADCPPCSVTLGAVSEKEMMDSANLDDALINKLKLPISAKEAYGRYGRQAPADAADTLGATAAPAPAVHPQG